MKAIIRNPRTAVLPRFHSDTGPSDVHSTHVQVTVDYYTDDGDLYHSQDYHRLPGDFDESEFAAQAAAMQADLDHSEANKDHAASSALAQQIVDRLKGVA